MFPNYHKNGNKKYYLVNIDYLKNDLGTFYVSNIYQNGNKKCRKCRKSADSK